MQIQRHRLDRFLSIKTGIKRRDVRLLLAQKRVLIDNLPATSINQSIDIFSCINLDGKILQNHQRRYLMLNKPKGVVSATRDHKNKTVIDLIDTNYRHELHIVGRLDFNSTGLLLLSNDGQWSRELTLPNKKIKKHYRVTLEKPVDSSYIEVFQQGIYFEYEDITTQPAGLNIINSYSAEVTLTEGRYHQIKRMFAHLGNKVIELHRHRIGQLNLDLTLESGQKRTLNADEIKNINSTA